MQTAKLSQQLRISDIHFPYSMAMEVSVRILGDAIAAKAPDRRGEMALGEGWETRGKDQQRVSDCDRARDRNVT